MSAVLERPTLTIRPAEFTDRESIVAIHKAAFLSGVRGNYQEWYQKYSYEELEENVDVGAGWPQDLDDLPDGLRIFVAENDEGKVVGVAKLALDKNVTIKPTYSTIRADGSQSEVPMHVFDDDTAAFFGRFVHPDHQGEGIGKKLLQAQLDVLKQHGKTKAMVQIFANHSREDGKSKWQEFWLKLGAKPHVSDVCIVKGYLVNEQKRAIAEHDISTMPEFVRTNYFLVDVQQAQRILSGREAPADTAQYEAFHRANEPENAAENYKTLKAVAERDYIEKGKLTSFRL